MYAIVDQTVCEEQCLDPIEFAKAFFNMGGEFLQYRNKVSSFEKVLRQTEILLKESQTYKKKIIINDYPEIADLLDIGFHIGQEDLSSKKVVWQKAVEKKRYWGLSTHNRKELEIAIKYEPDYIGFGSIFPSSTKTALRETSLSLCKVLEIWEKPVVLIGGITLERLKELPKSPRIFYAVIRDFFRYGNSPDSIEKYTKNFLARFKHNT